MIFQILIRVIAMAVIPLIAVWAISKYAIIIFNRLSYPNKMSMLIIQGVGSFFILVMLLLMALCLLLIGASMQDLIK